MFSLFTVRVRHLKVHRSACSSMMSKRPSSMDAEKACKKYMSSMERSVHFWSEARGESRKITAARLKCAPHSDAAESLALTIWERMRPEQFRHVAEIDRLLTAHDEIRVAELRETLGQILEAVDIEIKELRAVHNAPIEALTLLLNHIIKIYNQREVDSETSSDGFVPVSTRIEQMVAKAEELGLGSIEIPKYMYVSERAKMAMVEKQIMGRMKLKSIHKVKFKKIGGGKKREETRMRLKKAVAIKERLKLAQTIKSSKSKGYLKFTPSSRTDVGEYSSLLMSDEEQSNSHSRSSFPQEGSCESVKTIDQNESSKSAINEGTEGDNASIDTSSWVISSTHKYYFGCSPPVIPKTSVTHEVYTKPVQDSEMTELENAGESDLRFFHNVGDADAHWVGPKRNFSSKCSLDKTILCTVKEMSDTDRDKAREVTSTASSESRDSFTMVTNNEEINCEESHGDASTIFAWTEPEKSHSFCLNPAENVVDVGPEAHLMQASSDAAGDGCDLARTREESSIHTLNEEQEEIEVLPPTAFSMTNVAMVNDSNTSFMSDNSPMGIQKKNLFSCNQFSEDISKSEGDASEKDSKTDSPALETSRTSFGIQDMQECQVFDSDDDRSSSNELTFEENAGDQQSQVDASLEKSASAARVSVEPGHTTEALISKPQAELQFTVLETITLSPKLVKTEKITPAQKYVQPSSSASTSANPKLSKSIIDELTVEILKRNSMSGCAEAKKETGDSNVNSERDFPKAGTSRTEDFCKGDNLILESSVAPSQSSYNRVTVQNEDDSRNGGKTVWAASPLQHLLGECKAPEESQPVTPDISESAATNEVPSNHQPDCSGSSATKEATPTSSVDQFSSAHDFGGTQLLYIRPTAVKQKIKPSKALTSEKVKATEDKVRSSGSTHSQYEAVSDLAPTESCGLDGDSKKGGKRNDMVTLAVLALALGLGTLGFMTSSGTGSGGIFSDVLGPAGGKALNVVEKALQVLRTLNNRH